MAAITQFRPFGASRMRYGSFAGKPPAAVPSEPYTQFRPFGASRMRYGSFLGKPEFSPPAGGDGRFNNPMIASMGRMMNR